jgi:hypothetical protein
MLNGTAHAAAVQTTSLVDATSPAPVLLAIIDVKASEFVLVLAAVGANVYDRRNDRSVTLTVDVCLRVEAVSKLARSNYT